MVGALFTILVNSVVDTFYPDATWLSYTIFWATIAVITIIIAHAIWKDSREVEASTAAAKEKHKA
jgi:ABC-type branched-subunit amino acid transport system permease subunit